VTPEGDLSAGAPGERIIPKNDVERQAIARRVVADRCLYGVDVNPMAVEMAKLSLWLTTLQREKPFGFLDHSIRCGDALLGVTDAWQLERLDLINPNAQMVLASDSMRGAIERASELRKHLAGGMSETVQDVERKATLLAEAESELVSLRAIADALLAAYLDAYQQPGGRRARKLRANLAQDLSSEALKILDSSLDKTARSIVAQSCAERAHDMSQRGAPTGAPVRRPLHWLLEFPEVLDRSGRERGFAAFVGNPPFSGGQRITGTLGTDYRTLLLDVIASGVTGSSDLVAYMFLRVGSLLRSGGNFGLIATNTIAQGDTREVGLDQMLARGFAIYRSAKSSPWPGDASLEVSHVWAHRGEWSGKRELDGYAVAGITSQLTAPGAIAGRPYRLLPNGALAFQGSIVLGAGFLLQPPDAQQLIARSIGNRDVLFPYLNGEDLNSRVDQSPSRWVINFQDWPLDRSAPPAWRESNEKERERLKRSIHAPSDYPGRCAIDYPEILQIVEEKVRPERQRKNAKGEFVIRKPRAERWWHHAEKSLGLYSAIRGTPRCLAVAEVSKHLMFAWVSSDFVFTHSTIIFAVQDDGFLALLESGLHFEWVRKYQSNLRDTSGNRYTPSDCFETFPLPEDRHKLDALGEALDEARRESCTRIQIGLTALYNRLHDPQCNDSDIVRLREIKAEIDRATLTAYGWSDLVPQNGFHRLTEGVRWSMQDSLRAEILDRLLALNHARHAAEVEEESSARA
jgi:hypothetical protein